MKKTVLYIIFGLCISFLLSCSNDSYDLSENTLMNSITDNKLLDNELLDSLGVLKQIEEKDTKHLKDFLNKMETKASLTPYEDREENAYSNLYAITGLPVYIKSRYYNNGLQYLTAGGANKELFFSTIHLKSNANKFYIEKYAPSTGTGEFIFSMQT